MRETKFKQTEVGLIPEDWEIRKLSSIGSLAMCKRVFQEQTTISGNIPFYKIGTFGKKADAYISEELFLQLKTSYRYPNYGDILISAAGTIGRTVVFDGKPSYFQDSNIVWLAHNQDCVLNTYLYYVYQTIKWNTEHTTIARLYNDNFNNTVISLPSLPEQSRIASALSEVDALLSSLDKVIAKKQAIKEGTMQQLLTSKMRLKGFKGEWKTFSIGNDCSVKARIGWQGLTTEEYLDNGEFRLVTGTDIKDGKVAWETCHYVAKDRFEQDPNIIVQPYDVLVTKDGTIGKVAVLDSIPIPATLNSGVFVIRSKNEKLSQRGLALAFLSPAFEDFIRRLTAGSTIVHLYQKDIVKFKFKLPPTEDEQLAIISLLETMDNELKALQAKHKKYEAVKQGMMQQLLTGKIRLV